MGKSLVNLGMEWDKSFHFDDLATRIGPIRHMYRQANIQQVADMIRHRYDA
jgi:hypothetical protein